jgi:hypothetical protein
LDKQVKPTEELEKSMSESHYDRCRAYFNQATEQNEDVPAQTDLDILKIVLVAEIMEHHCSAPIVDNLFGLAASLLTEKYIDYSHEEMMTELKLLNLEQLATSYLKRARGKNTLLQ